MRVCNISLDAHILVEGSAVERRLILLSEKVGEMTVLIPFEKDVIRQVSPHLTVRGVGGSKLVQFFKIWNIALKEIRRQPYDLITVQDAYFLGFLAVQLGNRFSIPVEVQVHGFEKLEGGRAHLARYVLSCATKIRVVSERLRRELTTNYQLPTTKLYLLPVATQVDVPLKVTKRKTVPYPFTFLTVGRLVPIKNIGLQVRAIAKLAEKIPHIRLQIVGEGPLADSLKCEVVRLKLEEKVVFEGYQKDLNRFYEEADAFLLTSNSEGWGRVVLEAAAHRLPIIMTDVGLAREVIRNNESGFIISVGDEHELVLAMKELLDKPDLRVRLGEGAVKAFKSLPSNEEQIQKQIKEWNVLVDRK